MVSVVGVFEKEEIPLLANEARGGHPAEHLTHGVLLRA